MNEKKIEELLSPIRELIPLIKALLIELRGDREINEESHKILEIKRLAKEVGLGNHQALREYNKRVC